METNRRQIMRQMDNIAHILSFLSQICSTGERVYVFHWNLLTFMLDLLLKCYSLPLMRKVDLEASDICFTLPQYTLSNDQ